MSNQTTTRNTSDEMAENFAEAYADLMVDLVESSTGKPVPLSILLEGSDGFMRQWVGDRPALSDKDMVSFAAMQAAEFEADRVTIISGVKTEEIESGDVKEGIVVHHFSAIRGACLSQLYFVVRDEDGVITSTPMQDVAGSDDEMDRAAKEIWKNLPVS